MDSKTNLKKKKDVYSECFSREWELDMTSWIIESFLLQVNKSHTAFERSSLCQFLSNPTR